MMWPFKKESKRCPCGNELKKGSAIIQYRCVDDDTQDYIINKMEICKICADELDRQTVTKEKK